MMLAPFRHCQGAERMRNTWVYFISRTYEQFELPIISLSSFIVSAFFGLLLQNYLTGGKNSFLGLTCEYIQIHTSFHKKVNDDNAQEA